MVPGILRFDRSLWAAAACAIFVAVTARFSRWPRRHMWGAAAASLILILYMTFPHAELQWRPSTALPWNWSTVPGDRDEWLANVALFVPAGAALVSLLWKPWISLAILLALSGVIEALQSQTGRVASLLDVAANGVGAAVGVTGGVCFLQLRRLGSSARGDNARATLSLVVVVTLILAVTARVPLTYWSAHRLAEDVGSGLARWSYDDMRSVLAGQELADGRDSTDLFRATGVFPHIMYADDDATISALYIRSIARKRYCVRVEVRPDSRSVTTAYGDDCHVP